MRSECVVPLNIGSEEMVTVNELTRMIATIAQKTIRVRHIDGPVGVRGRNSDNRLMFQSLQWRPSQPLVVGLEKTYQWIQAQVAAQRRAAKLSVGVC